VASQDPSNSAKIEYYKNCKLTDADVCGKQHFRSKDTVVRRPNRNERVHAHRKAGRSSCKVMEVVRFFFLHFSNIIIYKVPFSGLRVLKCIQPNRQCL